MKRQLTLASIAAGMMVAALVFYAAPFQIASRPISATMPSGAVPGSLQQTGVVRLRIEP